MRFVSSILGVAAVVAAVVTVGPAAEAKGVPSQVGLVTVESATTSSLTFTWPAAPGADSYQVEQATRLDMSDRKPVTTTSDRQYTVKGLAPGGFYCFQVRAVNRTGKAPRSRKACQYTIADQGADRGATYRVVTYNTCGVACANWPSRRTGAADLVRAQQPDVVMLQETTPTSGLAGEIGGLSQAKALSGKALLYRTSRFTPAKDRYGQRVGSINLGYDDRKRRNRYAVWAELVDHQAADKHVIFVSVHLSPGPDGVVNDDYRRGNTEKLLQGLKTINPAGLPVVVAGDFNSNQGRDYDSPSTLMQDAGFGNSFFLAEHWTMPNYNSATKNLLTPTLGTPWGYHVDQVWVDPDHTVVREWANGARLVGSNYPDPMISNHSPIMAELTLD